ncbi:4Fe-4S binding protein [Ferruginibacter yonginensis]|uniref:4Fe-4S binding protein n=1 Tax=Ferruginibacter yonginensis TaxID=1310416 RepID=A0ABV8QR28_9BACT
MNYDISLSVASHAETAQLNTKMKVGVALIVIAAFVLGIGLFNQFFHPILLGVFIITLSAGSLLYTNGLYADKTPGIKNNGVMFKSLTSRGLWAWVLGVSLTAFYILLYWYPQYLGLNEKGNTGLVRFFDPLSYLLSGHAASQWFVYGTLYTLAILLMGVKFIYKNIHSKYQVLRTLSIMFFQLILAFLLPEILGGLNLPYNDFKNMWPLNYYFFHDWHIKELLSSGSFGMFVLVWGILLITVISPFLTYYFGKRWYCSWVCGCGGLAETAGDPFRQLSSKKMSAWKLERVTIYSVLIFAVVMTALVIYNYFTGASKVLFLDAYKVREWYGFIIGAAFSGVIGVGFYPIFGSRVWCRFGCPMAAILGIQQKFFSRFRITTNGSQCISCGNCSTYCEMGIDVRAYAQRGQDIVRSSCVGCGVCSAVCPRGVLKLENGPKETKKLDGPIQYKNGDFIVTK